MDYSKIATLPNLQPGQTSPDVKKLQQWLIQNGYNIPDGATGYYGPQTKSAVSSWQQKSGIDPQGNPGYFGPISKSYIQSQSQALNQGQQAGTGASGTSALSSNDTDALHFLGFTDQQIKSMSPSDQKNFALTGTYLQKQTDLGNVQSQNNAQSLQKAYTAALADPDIAAKYGDVQKADQANFTSNLQAFQTGLDVDSANQKLAFQKQQKDLAEQSAAAGQAYSGFRNQAKQQLDTQQSGVVKSTMSQIRQNIQAQAAPLEQYYGTSTFNKLFPQDGFAYNNPLTGQTQDVTYNTIGGVTGTQQAEKKSDVTNRQSQIYQNTVSPI